MICPFCSGFTPAIWQAFQTNNDELGRSVNQYRSQLQSQLPQRKDMDVEHLTVIAQWTQCQNESCREVIVRVTRTINCVHSTPPRGHAPISETWFAVPRHKAPPSLDLSMLDEPIKRDYLEAYVILEDCPRMSAVLSRLILSDLLKKYDGANHFSTAARIDKFVNNPNHPSRLRENLHYLREIADFGAHTQVEATANPESPEVSWEDVVINASPEEAEWTLKVVGDLFDYFIIAPAKDKLLREQFDEKIEKAGRKKISQAPKATPA